MKPTIKRFIPCDKCTCPLYKLSRPRKKPIQSPPNIEPAYLLRFSLSDQHVAGTKKGDKRKKMREKEREREEKYNDPLRNDKRHQCRRSCSTLGRFQAHCCIHTHTREVSSLGIFRGCTGRVAVDRDHREHLPGYARGTSRRCGDKMPG